MRALNKKALAVTALTVLGMTAANASVITAGTAGGSEALLSLVNVSTSATLTQDLGEQIGQINLGDTYNLSAASQAFISAAGGLSNVLFAVTAANIGANTYLQTSADEFFPDSGIINANRPTWASNFNLYTNGLNAGDATATGVNNTYGPFNSGTGSPNYLDGGHDSWGGTIEAANLGAGDSNLLLYTVLFATGAANNLLPATISAFQSLGFASLTANANQLTIGPQAVVPVPAALWLFGSGLGLLGALRRRGVPA